ncbi:alanine racemase [Iodidimonas sp. SYSU 1G8]|uniref:alanine racemase n=1 Tax=Iodidimonas sp. SYSU 1G8 TaxID=3133967 RepID=UPI0031FEF17C
MVAILSESLPGSAPGIIEIDLAALADNYRAMRARAHGAEVAAAVKADAYGLGADRVGPALWGAGCRSYFVASLGEGAALRQILPDAAILVLNGLMPGNEAAYEEFGLRPVLNDIDQVRRWEAFCRKRDARFPAALHVDTGFNRLGLPVAEAEAVAGGGPLGFDVACVMSHLACARQPEHPKNSEQLAQFRRVTRLFPRFRASLANSAGVLLGASYCFDLARVGIALYGGNPLADAAGALKPVVRLSARVLQERTVAAGETVGYDASFVADRQTRLAVIGAGYADGWPTSASGRGACMLGDARVPFVGRVSMDLIALDVTDAPAGSATAGSLVDLVGPRWSLDDAAEAAGLISYELLTGLSRRFERRYVMADAG